MIVVFVFLFWDNKIENSQKDKKWPSVIVSKAIKYVQSSIDTFYFE